MTDFFIFSAGFLAAFIGSMAGGGAGFISIFALLAVGLPLPAVIATNRLGDLGFYPMSIHNFAKSKHIVKKNLYSLIPINFVGLTLGTFIVIELNEQLLKWFISVALIIVLVFFLFHKKTGINKSKSRWWWSPSFFFSSIYGGLVGAGTGAFYMFSLTAGRGMTALGGAAHTFASVYPAVIFSNVIFLMTGLVNVRLGVILLIGNLFGSYLGSKIAIKKGNHFVRWILLGVIVLTIVRLWFLM